MHLFFQIPYTNAAWDYEQNTLSISLLRELSSSSVTNEHIPRVDGR